MRKHDRTTTEEFDLLSSVQSDSRRSAREDSGVSFEPASTSTKKPRTPKVSARGAIAQFGANVWGGITNVAGKIGDGFKAIGNFIKDHKYAIGVVALSILGGAALTAAIIFFWPGVVAAAAAFTVALPTIGTVAPLAWLASLSLPGAAAVLGAFGIVGGMVAGATLYGVGNFLKGTWNFLKHTANFFRSSTPSAEPATKAELKDMIDNEIKDVVKAQVKKQVEKQLNTVHQHISEEEARLGQRVENAAGIIIRTLQPVPTFGVPTMMPFPREARREEERREQHVSFATSGMGTFTPPQPTQRRPEDASLLDLDSSATASKTPELH
ncbi:hypothetical protein [Legionella micdadei]|uniref:hypothetical protein n=1 Tax=Legionella micdadei TaxID=451 RepID=UPI003A80F40D